jgi:hypothetical protein
MLGAPFPVQGFKARTIIRRNLTPLRPT